MSNNILQFQVNRLRAIFHKKFAGSFIIIFISALIVNAACVLHNIAKHHNVPDAEIYREDFEEENIEADDMHARDMRARGNLVRETIVQRYFT